MPRPGGSTPRWRRVRQMVLDRDGHRCRMRDVQEGRYLPHLSPWVHTIRISPRCTGRQPDRLQAHHVRGQDMGDDPRWLVTSCRNCNLATGHPRGDPAPYPVQRW